MDMLSQSAIIYDRIMNPISQKLIQSVHALAIAITDDNEIIRGLSFHLSLLPFLMTRMPFISHSGIFSFTV